MHLYVVSKKPGLTLSANNLQNYKQFSLFVNDSYLT